MKQIDIDKQLATMRARIAELERKNREQAAIIRLKDEHIADLRADIVFNRNTIESLFELLELAKKPKPAKCKMVRLDTLTHEATR